MFRNESEEVIRKAKATAKAKAASRIGSHVSSLKSATPDLTWSPSTPSEPNAQSHSELVRHQSLISSKFLSCSYNLAPTIGERATGYFYANYVVGADGPWDDILDDNMAASVKALGLAGFSNAAHAPDIMIEAREQYLRAIRLTNAALRSPVDVKKDSTLLAILILGMFETVTGRNQRSIKAWASHVNGAAALLKVRGPQQMTTPGGRRMFAQVTSSLVTTCIQYRLKLPDHILELKNEATKYQEPDDPIWLFIDFMITFTNFKASVQHKEITDPSVIHARALELDRLFLSICSNVPPGWEYKIIYTDADPDVIYAGYYHVYHDFLIAQIWNGMRTFRIMLHEIIQDVLRAWLDSLPELQVEQGCAARCQNSTVLSSQNQVNILASTPLIHRDYTSNDRAAFLAQLHQSTKISYQLQSDILASIPQHLGYVSKPDTQPSQDTSNGLDDTSLSLPKILWSNFSNKHPYPYPATSSPSSSPHHLPLLRMTDGYALLWPLYLAGIMDIATEPAQRWVVETLRSIARSTGTQQAFVLADMVEQKITLNKQKEVPTYFPSDLSDIDTEIDLMGDFQGFTPVLTATPCPGG
ncbi:hypothetical protein MMC18_003071 [Xylographa bjoerkii]|nr:hypothetical protein [Xylographa bjoerkii]